MWHLGLGGKRIWQSCWEQGNRRKESQNVEEKVCRDLAELLVIQLIIVEQNENLSYFYLTVNLQLSKNFVIKVLWHEWQNFWKMRFKICKKTVHLVPDL